MRDLLWEMLTHQAGQAEDRGRLGPVLEVGRRGRAS